MVIEVKKSQLIKDARPKRSNQQSRKKKDSSDESIETSSDSSVSDF
jgi:hypothetical protein